MLLYLDNHGFDRAELARRRGSSTAAATGRKVGINENLAREILELHTLGVDGGYTQADVTDVRAGDLRLVDRRPGQRPQAREARRRQRHARRVLLSRSLPRARREDVVRQELRRRRVAAGRGDPARSRRCGRRPRGTFATKLARHFIADDPPPAVVERIDAGLARFARHICRRSTRRWSNRPEAWEQPLAKFKTPADYIYSSYRALGIPLREKRRSLQAFEALGQRNLMPGSPAGWPDTSADWDGSSALLKRIAWADVVAQRMGDARNARELAPQLLGATLERRNGARPSRAPKAARRR